MMWRWTKMSQFLEADLEEAALDWLSELDYEIIYGPDIASDGAYPERNSYQDVVLNNRLEDALTEINPDISVSSIQQAIRQLTRMDSQNLLVNNQQFQSYVTDGIDIETQLSDGRQITEKVWLFDCEEMKNNDFVAVKQYTVIEGKNDKRPDIALFINGLPLVVMELKSASDETAGITEAFHQLQTYKNTITSLFPYNAFLIISDGMNARAESLTAQATRFTMWHTTDGQNHAPTSELQLETLLQGMLLPPTLLDMLRHFVVFLYDREKTALIVAADDQYQAVHKEVEQAQREVYEAGGQKLGVIWH